MELRDRLITAAEWLEEQSAMMKHTAEAIEEQEATGRMLQLSFTRRGLERSIEDLTALNGDLGERFDRMVREHVEIG